MAMKDPSVLGVGVIGLGAMGQDHARTLSEEVAGAIVTEVYDLDGDRAQQTATTIDARRAASAEDVITSTDVDAVVIASPDPTHAALTVACLQAGKPVLCEKPLGADAEDSQSVVDAELATGRRLVTVGLMRRFDPGYLELRQAVRGGVVGEPLLVHNVHRNAVPHPSATSEGLIANSMVHELDILPWLLGSRLTAIEVRSPRPGGLRDPQLATLELDDGAVVATVEVYLSATYGYDVRCEVVGTSGTVALRAPGGLTLAREGRTGVAVPGDFRARFAEAYRAELSAWVRAVREGATCGASAWAGHLATLAAAAGVDALHSGRRVPVPTPERPALYS